MLDRQNLQRFRRELAEGGEVFVKPRKGSLGLGIARVVRTKDNRYRYESRKLRKSTSLEGAWQLVCKGRHGYLMQSGIPLLEDDGRRVDLRVPVQRDGKNRWHIAGIAAKRAERLPFLTNLARGGSVHDAHEILARHFGEQRAQTILDEIRRLAILVAETLNVRYPRLVDLGLDVGVDQDGHPYLIEVNRRDLRILLQKSGQRKAYETLYKNPIAYARLVLQDRSIASAAHR